MKTRKWPSFFMAAIIAVLCLESCQDWGEMDPPSGNQVYPRLELKSEYKYEEALDPEQVMLVAYDGGNIPKTAKDEFKGKVLQLDGGYARYTNPLYGVKLQAGASISMWIKTAKDNLNGAIFAFCNEDNSKRLFFTPNAWLRYESAGGSFEVNNPSGTPTEAFTPDEWHYLAMSVKNDGYTIYIDGELKFSLQAKEGDGSFDFSQIVQSFAELSFLYLGYGSGVEPEKMWVDDVKIYRNLITSKETAVPAVSGGSAGEPIPDPVYFNNFERGLDGATIQGAGTLEHFGGNFGTVFTNVGGKQRSNYLLLPKDVLSHSSSTRKMTITFWVNSTKAGTSNEYMWAPLFMAYGAAPISNANTSPAFTCQYRGILAGNFNGPDNAGDNWCDFTDAQCTSNDKKVVLYHDTNDWLADKKWHLYSVVLTEKSAAIYFDGELANSWEISGSGAGNTIAGLFDGTQLNYICLGGNQAWDWGDNDPGFMFDDIAIYNQALAPEQLKTLVENKNTLPDAYYFNGFETGTDKLTIQGGGSFADQGALFGNVFQNVGGAQRTNYLLLPEDALSGSKATKQMSIAFWVNASKAGASADYQWAPIFTAYAAAPAPGNGAPMLACQYRGVVMLNMGGDNWCDYTDAQNDAKKNVLYQNESDWLADHQWHLYTAVFTETTAAVYFDGELKNSWTISGSGAGNTVGNLFGDNGLKYVCLGGNQAWDWGDPDPGFMFDHIAIYNVALTPEQINAIVMRKK